MGWWLSEDRTSSKSFGGADDPHGFDKLVAGRKHGARARQGLALGSRMTHRTAKELFAAMSNYGNEPRFWTLQGVSPHLLRTNLGGVFARRQASNQCCCFSVFA